MFRFYHIATIHLPPLLVFFPCPLSRAHTFLIVVFKLQRQSLLYPVITSPFIARTERIATPPFYNSATTAKRSSPPRAESKLSSNWNFVAVRQFVHYPRSFAGSSASSSISLLQLLFTPSLFPPPPPPLHFSRALC